jgi:hypothetical protein
MDTLGQLVLLCGDELLATHNWTIEDLESECLGSPMVGPMSSPTTKIG